MRNNSLNIGTIMYRYVDENIEYHLLTKVNENKYSLKNQVTGETVVYTGDELNANGFSAILPDGIMVIAVVDSAVGNVLQPDVMTTLFRTSDMEADKDDPIHNLNVPKGAVCRQNCTDVFYQMANPSDPRVFSGLCVSWDTCPPNANYIDIMSCVSIRQKTITNIAVYREDTLDTILAKIPSKKLKMYDDILAENFARQASNASAGLGFSKEVMKTILNSKTHLGYCKTYRDLLETNNFIMTFWQSLDVLPVNIDFEDKEHVNIRDDKEKIEMFSHILRKNIKFLIARKFTHTVVVDGLKYFYLMDNRNNLYVMLYADEGEYVIPADEFEAYGDNMEKMAKAMPSKSVLNALNYMREQNISKY